MSKSAKSDRAKKAGEDGRARSFRVSGQLLCSLRLARGWTQLEAAERAGLSERLLRMAEAGESLGFRSIVMLAQLYSTLEAPLSPDELVIVSLTDSPGAAGGESPIETIVRRWYAELWNQGRLEIVAELAAADCVLHAAGRRLRGRAAICRYLRTTRSAWGEFKLIARRPAVFGEVAVARWRLKQKNVPLSSAGLPERLGELHGSTWFHVADGLLRQAWRYVETPRPSSGGGTICKAKN